MYFDMFCNPSPITAIEPVNDKVFSPEHAHMPPDMCQQVNYAADDHCGQQLQYGTNEPDITKIIDSFVNWDELSCEDSTLLNARDNGLGSDSDVEMAFKQVKLSSNTSFLLVILAFTTIDMCQFAIEWQPDFYHASMGHAIGPSY